MKKRITLSALSVFMMLMGLASLSPAFGGGILPLNGAPLVKASHAGQALSSLATQRLAKKRS